MLLSFGAFTDKLNHLHERGPLLMDISMMLGLVVGGVIGFAFAWLQLQALRRNELLEQQAEMPGWLKRLPGAGGRVAFLLMTFVLAQVCFQGANVPSMAIGVAIAYAIPFALRLKDKYSHRE